MPPSGYSGIGDTRSKERRSSDVGGDASELYGGASYFNGKPSPSRLLYQNCLPSDNKPDDTKVDLNLTDSKLLENRLHNSKTTDLHTKNPERDPRSPESRFLASRQALESRLLESNQPINTSHYENRKFIGSTASNINVGDRNLTLNSSSYSRSDCSGNESYSSAVSSKNVSRFNSTENDIIEGTSKRDVGDRREKGGTAPRPPARQASSSTMCKALYDYEAKGDDELSLQCGDVLEVLSRDAKISGDEGWWTGKINGKVGTVC